MKVPRFSPKVYEQCAGFLRIYNGKQSLDATGVHPERYSAVRDMAQEIGTNVSQLMGEGAKKIIAIRTKWAEIVGQFTFEDIVRELEKPGRDPRDPFKAFSFRDDIFEVKDLKESMICPGIVTNVTNFGAFVDIGVHQDGLVHISALSTKFVDDPRKVVNPGDQVTVRVLGIDLDKNQISLSMVLDDQAAKQARAERAPREERKPNGAEARGPRPAASGGPGSGPRPQGDRSGGGGPSPRGPRPDGDRPRSGPRPQMGARPGGPGGGPRPQGNGDRPHQGGGGGFADQRGGSGPSPRKPSSPFNNAFAALLGNNGPSGKTTK
jgi:uncharacterized protein